jgi:hypothetical protein
MYPKGPNRYIWEWQCMNKKEEKNKGRRKNERKQ